MPAGAPRCPARSGDGRPPGWRGARFPTLIAATSRAYNRRQLPAPECPMTQFEAQDGLPVPRTSTAFPVRNCGSDMRFAPTEGKLICDHCGHDEPIEAEPAGPWGAATPRRWWNWIMRPPSPPSCRRRRWRRPASANAPSRGAQVSFRGRRICRRMPVLRHAGGPPTPAPTGTSNPKGVIPFKLTEETGA